jgi:hypothetical protein
MDIEASPLGPGHVEARPKDIIMALFEVKNTSDRAFTVTTDAHLPEGWRLITPPAPFTLARGASSVVLASLAVSQSAGPATYDAVFTFTPLEGGRMPSVQILKVTVLPVRGIDVKLMEAPGTVMAGSAYEAVFLVRNNGNSGETILLSVFSLADFPARPDFRELTLGPGRSQKVRVSVETPDGLTQPLTHRLVLRADAQGPEPSHAEAWATVEVIGTGTTVLERLNTIPATLRIRQAFQKDGDISAPIQADLEAAGTVDKEGGHHLEIQLTGPDTQDRSIYGTQDKYLLHAYSKDYDLAAGDSQFNLSPLTEQYLSARGIGVSASYKGLSVKGFSASPPRTEPDMRETGAALGCRITEWMDASIHGLIRDEEHGVESRVFSAQTRLAPAPWMDMEVEAARGEKDSRDKEALRAMISSQLRGCSTIITYVDADPDFPGYYQNKHLLALDVCAPAGEAVKANLSFCREASDAETGPYPSQAPIDTRVRTGIDWNRDRATTYSIGVAGRRLKDRLPTPLTDYTEGTLRAGILKNLERVSFNLSAEGGARRNEASNESSCLFQAACSAYLRPGGELSYGLHLRYEDGVELDPSDTRTITAGASGTYLAAGGASVQFSAQADRDCNSRSRDKYMVSGSIRKPVSRTEAITVQAARNMYSGAVAARDETTLLLEYAHDFGLPVWTRKGTCAVAGVVKDASTKAPLPGVVIRLEGMTRATGADGRFAFSSLRPGPAYLGIDVSKLEEGSLPDCRNPLPVTLEEGKEETLEILVTKKAALAGSIELYQAFRGGEQVQYGLEGEGFPPGTQPEELRAVSGIANALVELKRPDQTLRTLTDQQGRFSFTDVRPGQWTLEVARDAVPQHHVLDKNQTTLHLMPGERQDLQIRAVPKKRTVRFMQDGGTIMQNGRH